ncbi:hypothetical protein Nepgr_020072 [Nepenthes gracilis]|uniref:Uncharacterized protein n=1 Tax=Nepenthes gracilis TaxID=150966 RepID=A0AAD3SYB8_NEPGR|nr:hypothetical protein Nepgr_020072 [Nepenthes gracilis]
MTSKIEPEIETKREGNSTTLPPSAATGSSLGNDREGRRRPERNGVVLNCVIEYDVVVAVPAQAQVHRARVGAQTVRPIHER